MSDFDDSTARWQVRRLETPLSTRSIRAAIGSQPGGFLLDSAACEPRYGRYSYYGVGRPIELGAGVVLPRMNSGDSQRWRRLADGCPLPFVGGWVGFLSYEAGQAFEPICRRHTTFAGVPQAKWWACDTLLVYDNTGDVWYAAGTDVPGYSEDRPSPARRVEELANWAEGAAPGSREEVRSLPTQAALRSNMTRDEYVAAIGRIHEHLRAGDIYQVNFAQRFSAPFAGHPYELYERLCAANPAMFAACLAWDADAYGGPRTAVLSSSPELFLDLRGRKVVTRPIKGTRRRTGDAAIDAAARAELETSAKDRAELVMIVDLERNDLGRVCEFGSVRVVSAAETEIHPTVFHRVATVEGVLREDRDALELIAATFPGGSITGAPKVRAMQIIDALEPDPRGPYCGAIGTIGIDGSMMLNIAIRTMVVARGRVSLWAGGGIVIDSDADAEYAETLDKAEGMRRALGCDRLETGE